MEKLKQILLFILMVLILISQWITSGLIADAYHSQTLFFGLIVLHMPFLWYIQLKINW